MDINNTYHLIFKTTCLKIINLITMTKEKIPQEASNIFHSIMKAKVKPKKEVKEKQDKKPKK